MMEIARRELLKAGAALAVPLAAPDGAIVIDPRPLFDISPLLYMQFMEPLGVTDGSVEAAWDYDADDWRKDLVETVKDLSPGCIRWGGLYTRYYKWREGVGPVWKRPPHRNYVWGGNETNRVGTGEFADFCRRVGAEPLIGVNFLSDGQRRYRNTPREGNRSGDAREAADWVSYANDPDSRERKSNGRPEPYNIKLWQLGNETSYGADSFSRDAAIKHTIEFAKAMKRRDPSIRLIGWGDRGRKEEPGFWADEMMRQAGEHLDLIAIHLMGQGPRRPDTVLAGWKYRDNPEQAWDELLDLSGNVETKVAQVEEVLAARKSPAGIAVTEGHLGLRPHNANPILHEWLSAVYHARSMNIYQRHGERVRIATGADFCGTRWTVNAVMMAVPRGVSYLMPVGSVMRLFKRHNGGQGIAVTSAPAGLDVAGSRTADRIWLHVANLNYGRAVEASFGVSGMRITGGRVFEIAPESPRQHVNQEQPDVFQPREKPLTARWRFPAASVSAVELTVASADG